DTALSYNPTYAAAYIGRASLSLADGNTDAALADYEQAVNFAPDNAEARVVRGALLADRGDYAVATTDYTRALTANPDDAALYIARALAYRCDVQPALAVADLTRAADIDLDTVALTLTNRATYDCTGMEAPPFDPDRVGVTDPDLTGAYTYVARALAARADERLISGDDVGVVNDLTRAAQLTPSYTEAATWLHQRGVLYEGQGNLNAALADYEIAVDITPERADYHADLGRIYARLGDTDAARLSLTRAIERDPSLMGAYITRADVFLRDDFPQAALYDFAAAVDLDPVYVPALAGRVRALVALGACTDAGAALPGVEAISPDAPEVEAARLAYNGACLAVNEG
ncbi:MAG: tetratricopeptide repeat protein, partial [Pseudomonadota bacterium]